MFLLISFSVFFPPPGSVISIHLMFLLIAGEENGRGGKRNFNTSHVSINQISQKICLRWKSYFNTSHVSINLEAAFCYSCGRRISIHLMFLLIKLLSVMPALNVYFNTSHVSINPSSTSAHKSFCNISIHLMFLLIRYLWQKSAAGYTISIHLMFLLITEPDAGRNRGSVISIHLMFLLIFYLFFFLPDQVNFNTSHVSINPVRIRDRTSTKAYFNTSHVSINRRINPLS